MRTDALVAKGFRPFFFLAGAFAALILPVWLFTLAGMLGPGRYLDAITWHAHEMIFGFTAAVIAGFLLTAVGNWTSRETLVGAPLIGACALWLAGRIAMALGGVLPRGVPAAIDLAFLPVLMVAIARPLAATKNRKNFVMVAVLGLIWTANLAIHLDALGIVQGWSHRALVLAVDVIVLLMIVIAGRVFPMFTKNATSVPSVRGRPAFDKAAILAMALTVVLDATTTDARIGGAAAAVTALLVVLRAWTWGMRHTVRVPLLWILHAGHAWIALGLGLRAAAAFTTAVPPVIATHALTVGAIGALTIGMMSRVSLGHTGRTLVASPAMVASFALVTFAAIVRVAGPLLDMTAYRTSVFVAGGLWTAAFVLFVVVIRPVVVGPRVDGKAG
jgi:uncharacterized protein involved in response to NO